MIIRKLFKFEGSHVVRGCTSKKCRENIHGHSYKVEVLIEGDKLDNGQMIVDFGLLKSHIKDFIEAFDHTHVIWEKGSMEEKDFFSTYFKRWVTTPLSPSAEGFAIMFYNIIAQILARTGFNNGEGSVRLHSIIVHETDTGYAQAFKQDAENYSVSINDFTFSSELRDWNISTIYNVLGSKSKTV